MHRARLMFAFLGLAVVTALGTSRRATAESPSGLTGTVVDATTQSPVPGATVTARGAALLGEQVAVTDHAGGFEMTLLPAGTFALTVEHDGFQAFSQDGFVLRGRALRINVFILPVQGAAPPPPPSAAESALEFNDAMTAPSMISGPSPEYSPEAIEHEIEGQMQVRCIVTVEGMVRSCKVLQGLPFMNGAVISALERRKYKPAQAQGKPVSVFYTFNLKLKLPQQ